VGDTLHIRVRRGSVVKAEELEKAIELGARRTGPEDAILVLLDADDDCPKELAPRLLERAKGQRPDRRIGVVLAKREFEAWLVASVESLRGYRELDSKATAPKDVEGMRNPKGWLTRLLPPGSPYSPTIDQAPMAERIDLEKARTAPSFDKLCRELVRLLGPGPSQAQPDAPS
jgi:hypothetical protein